MFFGATAFAEAPFASEGIISISVTLTGVNTNAQTGNGAITANADLNLSTNLIQTDSGSVTINLEVVVPAVGNTLNSTTGSLSVSADGNISLSTNLLQFEIDSVSIAAGASAFIAAGAEVALETTVNSVAIDIAAQADLIGLQLNTFVGNVNVDVITIATLSTNLIQSNVSSVAITADANVNVSTNNLLQTALGNEVITANANVNLTTNLLQTASGDVITFINVDVNLSTNLIQTDSGSVIIGIGVPVTGVQMQMSIKTPVVVAWAVIPTNVTNTWATVSTNTTNTWSVVDIAA